MRHKLRLLALPGILTITLTANAAHAANCAERDKVVSKLTSGYGETFAGGGMQNENRIYEVWFSEDKGTWTILMTRPDGSTCVMASGTHWREGLPGDTPAKGTPS